MLWKSSMGFSVSIKMKNKKRLQTRFSTVALPCASLLLFFCCVPKQQVAGLRICATEICVNHVWSSTTQVNNKCSAKLCSASFVLHEILLGGCEWKGQNCVKGGGTFTREECSWACARFLNSWGQSKVFAFKWAQLTCPWSPICNPNSWHLSPWSYSRTSKMNRKYSKIQLWLSM